ncbi:hypothetical protein AB0L44_42160 [Nonomuraea wenchangensis]|uniref:hypothetical protein n=1 Tax=Nonomuraea wenchangensis TaxID=568860 RepID=UPI003444858E
MSFWPRNRETPDESEPEALEILFRPGVRDEPARGVTYGAPTPEAWDKAADQWLELDRLLEQSPLLARRTFGHEETNFDLHEWHAWAIMSAPAWLALANVLKTYLTRHNNRKVIIYGDTGKKIVEVTGDLTAKEIEGLLRSRVAPRELGGGS